MVAWFYRWSPKCIHVVIQLIFTKLTEPDPHEINWLGNLGLHPKTLDDFNSFWKNKQHQAIAYFYITISWVWPFCSNSQHQEYRIISISRASLLAFTFHCCWRGTQPPYIINISISHITSNHFPIPNTFDELWAILSVSSWWFQPLWNIFVKMEIFRK